MLGKININRNMSLHKIRSFPTSNIIGVANKFNYFRCLSIFPVRNLDQKWREEQRLPQNPNTHGPLTDKADYTFLDGRPTPYGVRQRQRIIKQRAIAQEIIDLTKEIDFAVERHAKSVAENEEHRKSIISGKLKQKGLLLLKEK